MVDDATTPAPAGLFRRLAALLYDVLLVIALAVVATFAMLPLTGGEAILTKTQGILGHAYHAAWLLVVFGYFAWCWMRSGQTLGLRAWRIRLERRDGRRIGWAGAALRYLAGLVLAWLAIAGGWYLRRAGNALETAGAASLFAPLLANFAWIPFDRERRSLLDLAGRMRAVRTR
jgi:uncharacterized RDD family membrane protein YckC